MRRLAADNAAQAHKWVRQEAVLRVTTTRRGGKKRYRVERSALGKGACSPLNTLWGLLAAKVTGWATDPNAHASRRRLHTQNTKEHDVKYSSSGCLLLPHGASSPHEICRSFRHQLSASSAHRHRKARVFTTLERQIMEESHGNS